ncbi:hypothetical protein [Empedobacter brevis]|uniref:hypothetical protein n=1 Tax=Empedobacter brevis TaxID=247 RepID=UPI0039B07E1B
MKYLLLIPSVFILFSCSNNDDDSITVKPVIPEKPDPEIESKEIYTYSDTFTILDQKYYKGKNGNEYPSEADDFFKKQWFPYENPSIKTIELKKDSIIINENLSIEKHKYTKDGNNILIEYGTKKIVLGYQDQAKKSLKIFKNYQTYSLIDKETGASLYSKIHNYGKVSYNDIFPLVVASPKELTLEGEFVFWSNIEYQFNKK